MRPINHTYQAGLRPSQTVQNSLHLKPSSPALFHFSDINLSHKGRLDVIQGAAHLLCVANIFAPVIDRNSSRRRTGVACAAPAIILCPCGVESRRHSIKTAQIERGRYPWPLSEFGYTECGSSRRDVKSSCAVKGEPGLRPATGNYFLRRCALSARTRRALSTDADYYTATLFTHVACTSLLAWESRGLCAYQERAGAVGNFDQVAA